MTTVLENLAIQRAKLTAQIKELKNASAGDCEYQWVEVDDMLIGKYVETGRSLNCIELAYRQCAELNENNYDQYSYDEVFENLDEPACEHCRKVRENKKARAKLKTKLGQINSHITKIGMRLAKNE